jgi:Transmembrane domain of unknown function (DUF3566)
VSTGPGESRRLGGGAVFGDPTPPARPGGSAVMPETARTEPIKGGPAGARDRTATSPAAPSAPPPPAGNATTARPKAMTVGSAAVTRKPPRRARLTLKRIDPWTTLKFSFVYGLAGMIVLLVAVVVLYGVVDALGVISSVKSFLDQVNGSGSNDSLAAWLGFERIMLVAFVIGLINVILFTAFATLTAFIYNVCTDIVGGVEVTLAERN